MHQLRKTPPQLQNFMMNYMQSTTKEIKMNLILVRNFNARICTQPVNKYIGSEGEQIINNDKQNSVSLIN
jgi:hypothetical protein